MIPGVYTGNEIPHDKYNIRGIAHAGTNRKDDIFTQRRLYIEEAHMGLDIFRFAVSFYLYSVSLGDALTTAAVRPFLVLAPPKADHSNRMHECGDGQDTALVNYIHILCSILMFH